MLATINVELNDVQRDLAKVFDDLGDRVCLLAVEAGGALIENEYRKQLSAIAKESGTYTSAQGAVEHLIQAYKSVGHRALKLKGGGGAFNVIGIVAASGSWRSQSPQALWLEEGADGHTQKDGRPSSHRVQKTTKQSTGIEAPRHTLANISESLASTVADTIQNVIASELAKV